jgi:iron complex transport system ATP-binding protein
MLEIRNLRFAYEAGHEVIKNLNLKIDRGDFVGIIGPNGCGKSTLVNLFSNVLTANHGNILINGQDIRLIPQNSLAQLVAVVPQESVFEFDFTALEIVLMGRLPYLSRFQLEGPDDRRIARMTMKKTKCWEFKDKYIKHLSGGEKQRVIVARALTQDPKLLLLDEPTSHLDLNFQFEVLDIISELNKNNKVTIISVFHDINLASKYCSRLVLMKSGRIIADGEPKKIITPENMAKIYDFKIILKRHPREGYKYILPDIIGISDSRLTGGPGIKLKD